MYLYDPMHPVINLNTGEEFAGIQSAIVVALIHAYKELKRTGAILLIEEPEVYLHPHARRYFYSLLKDLSEQETQVFFTTHST